MTVFVEAAFDQRDLCENDEVNDDSNHMAGAKDHFETSLVFSMSYL
jgi:hypothetical protein